MFLVFFWISTSWLLWLSKCSGLSTVEFSESSSVWLVIGIQLIARYPVELNIVSTNYPSNFHLMLLFFSAVWKLVGSKGLQMSLIIQMLVVWKAYFGLCVVALVVVQSLLTHWMISFICRYFNFNFSYSGIIEFSIAAMAWEDGFFNNCLA
jgi:hypothetical protein